MEEKKIPTIWANECKEKLPKRFKIAAGFCLKGK